MNRALAKTIIGRHEGLRTRLYKDSVGKLTIGFGRNVEDVGIRVSEAQLMLENDIEDVETQLMRLVPCFQALSTNRQIVLVDMGFMGVTKLMQFRKMFAALDQRDFETAADEMLASTWAAQVGQRAVELAAMMRAG